jgi:hypothetical protein
MVKNIFLFKGAGIIALGSLLLFAILFGVVIKKKRESFDSLCPYHNKIPGGLLDDGKYKPFPRAIKPRRTTGPPELDLCFDIRVRDGHRDEVYNEGVRKAARVHDVALANSLGVAPPEPKISNEAVSSLGALIKNITTAVEGQIPSNNISVSLAPQS